MKVPNQFPQCQAVVGDAKSRIRSRWRSGALGIEFRPKLAKKWESARVELEAEGEVDDRFQDGKSDIDCLHIDRNTFEDARKKKFEAFEVKSHENSPRPQHRRLREGTKATKHRGHVTTSQPSPPTKLSAPRHTALTAGPEAQHLTSRRTSNLETPRRPLDRRPAPPNPCSPGTTLTLQDGWPSA